MATKKVPRGSRRELLLWRDWHRGASVLPSTQCRTRPPKPERAVV